MKKKCRGEEGGADEAAEAAGGGARGAHADAQQAGPRRLAAHSSRARGLEGVDLSQSVLCREEEEEEKEEEEKASSVCSSSTRLSTSLCSSTTSSSSLYSSCDAETVAVPQLPSIESRRLPFRAAEARRSFASRSTGNLVEQRDDATMFPYTALSLVCGTFMRQSTGFVEFQVFLREKGGLRILRSILGTCFSAPRI